MQAASTMQALAAAEAGIQPLIVELTAIRPKKGPKARVSEKPVAII
jgi:hypothetical protein